MSKPYTPPEKFKWTKGYDTISNTPRYTFEGRDHAFSLSDICVTITVDRRRKYSHDPSSVKNYYKGAVDVIPLEMGEDTPEFERLKDCKTATEALFRKYCGLYPQYAGIGEELIARALGLDKPSEVVESQEEPTEAAMKGMQL